MMATANMQWKIMIVMETVHLKWIVRENVVALLNLMNVVSVMALALMLCVKMAAMSVMLLIVQAVVGMVMLVVWMLIVFM